MTDRKSGEFRYFRTQFPHDDRISPRQWFNLMCNIAEMITMDMVEADVPVSRLKWQFMIPLTKINDQGEYVHNPCPLIHKESND